MNTEVRIFNNTEFGAIRTSGTSEEPLFCAADICNALGYSNGRDAISRHCDEGDVVKRDMGVVTGKRSDGSDAIQYVSMTFVNESGLYALIFGSKLERAREFKHWVTSEVLPSIRKTGAFNVRDLSRAEILRMALEAETERAALMLENRQQQEQLEAQRPKVVFADAVAGSQNAILIAELAKMITQNGYEIGQNRLFEWMRQNHYLGTIGEHRNRPQQRYLEQGLFIIKENVHSENGKLVTSITPKVTGKGQQYFINKFIGKPSPVLQPNSVS